MTLSEDPMEFRGNGTAAKVADDVESCNESLNLINGMSYDEKYQECLKIMIQGDPIGAINTLNDYGLLEDFNDECVKLFLTACDNISDYKVLKKDEDELVRSKLKSLLLINLKFQDRYSYTFKLFASLFEVIKSSNESETALINDTIGKLYQVLINATEIKAKDFYSCCKLVELYIVKLGNISANLEDANNEFQSLISTNAAVARCLKETMINEISFNDYIASKLKPPVELLERNHQTNFNSSNWDNSIQNGAIGSQPEGQIELTAALTINKIRQSYKKILTQYKDLKLSRNSVLIIIAALFLISKNTGLPRILRQVVNNINAKVLPGFMRLMKLLASI